MMLPPAVILQGMFHCNGKQRVVLAERGILEDFLDVWIGNYLMTASETFGALFALFAEPKKKSFWLKEVAP